MIDQSQERRACREGDELASQRVSIFDFDFTHVRPSICKTPLRSSLQKTKETLPESSRRRALQVTLRRPKGIEKVWRCVFKSLTHTYCQRHSSAQFLTSQPSLIPFIPLPERRVDKYGRHVSRNRETDDLRRFYRLQDEDKPDAEEGPKAIDYARGAVLLESSDEGEDDEEIQKAESDEDDEQVVLGQHASKPIPVPGEDEFLEVDLNEDEDAYADLDAQAAAYADEHPSADAAEEANGSRTNRLAVVNLDWDHVRASHLYKIFSSLVSPTAPALSLSHTQSDPGKSKANGSKTAAPIVRGRVLSVRIYRSEFGKERLKKEEVEGPPKEIFKRNIHNEGEGASLIQEDDGTEYNENALRKYQLERLRYVHL